MSLLNQLTRRIPWSNWAFWPWLRYKLTWQGWRATLPRNPDLVPGDRTWKLHRCADGQQCRASIGGGCGAGYCAHYEVKPDETGVPRFPRNKVFPPK
ncbi:hypothetical protein [Burkholderia ubonensis]|uniref:hypothetical protein n=1 Tax=Burkholderia ubonensis TaxID=101571 RepID=UPI000B1FB14B|nr:hypothetical protein [Burkholderia ubonensis]